MNRGIEQDQGVAFGPGCQPSASAPDGSSQSGIPNADELAALVTAWEGAFSGLEAYLKDRINNHDLPSWEKVLRVLEGERGSLGLYSRQIYAATQARAQTAQRFAEKMRDAVEYAHSEGFEWPSDPFAWEPASVDRSGEAGETSSEANGLDPKDESAVPEGQTPDLPPSGASQ